ncbi:MAG: hypothetical protein ACRCZS_12190 [Chroococcidiopsis sp.]
MFVNLYLEAAIPPTAKLALWRGSPCRNLMTLKLYYFKDKKTGKRRNTGVVASSASAAKAKLRRPSPKNAVVYAVRSPTASERKTIAQGRWVRTRSTGKPPSSDTKRGYGPPRRKKR